jgi:hypothetical protein
MYVGVVVCGADDIKLSGSVNGMRNTPTLQRVSSWFLLIVTPYKTRASMCSSLEKSVRLPTNEARHQKDIEIRLPREYQK